jgi:hypothetical protein
MNISTARARRFVRLAQMAGLALGVSAAALWALEVPGLRGELPTKPAVEVIPVASQRAAAPAPASIDSEGVEGLAARLNEAAKRPPAAAPEQEKPVEAAAPPTAWRYIAPLKMGRQAAAIVFADGKQRVLRAGAKVGGTTLVSVDEARLVVEDGTGRHEIARGERMGSNVLWKKMESAAPASANGAGDPASAAELAKRGFDQSQAQRFREAMREKAALRRAEAAGQGGDADAAASGARGASGMGATGTGAGVTKLPDGMTDKDAAFLRDNPKLQSLIGELSRQLRANGMDATAQEIMGKLRANGVPEHIIEREIRVYKDSLERDGAIH